MTAVPDDIDARPGSTVSLLRTIVGLYLRRLDGWIASSTLVALASELGVGEAAARTGIARLKNRGLLLADRRDGVAGYGLNPAALGMLASGDRRIFTVRTMSDADGWCLVSFSIPESDRGLRHRLRRRLQWIGAGVVSPALWICPGHLHDEVRRMVEELGAADRVTLFRTGTPETADSPAEAAARWWDLEALRAEHLTFQAAVQELPTEPFAAYVRLIDAWRVLPYVDPGFRRRCSPPTGRGPRASPSSPGCRNRWRSPPGGMSATSSAEEPMASTDAPPDGRAHQFATSATKAATCSCRRRIRRSRASSRS